LALIQLLTTLPTSGLGAFANIIINGFNFSLLQTQLLAMVLGAYIIIGLLGSAWLVKKTGQNTIIMFISVLPSVLIISPLALADTQQEHHWKHHPDDRPKHQPFS
jgi:hypothetical protein